MITTDYHGVPIEQKKINKLKALPGDVNLIRYDQTAFRKKASRRMTTSMNQSFNKSKTMNTKDELLRQSTNAQALAVQKLEHQKLMMDAEDELK